MPDSLTTVTTDAQPEVATAAADAAPAPAHEALFREAFARQLPAMMRLTTEQLHAVNLDILGTITTVIGAWPEIRALRPQIARELPHLDQLDAGKLCKDRLHARIGFGHTLALVLFFLRLCAQGRLALFVGHDHGPAPPGPPQPRRARGADRVDRRLPPRPRAAVPPARRRPRRVTRTTDH